MEEAARDLTSFLEVAFHAVLFARHIYPRELFQKQQRYGLPVWISGLPSLNEYISSFATSLQPCLLLDELECVCLVILDETGRPVERVVCEAVLHPGAEYDAQAALEGFKSCLSKINLQASMRAPLLPQGGGHSFTAAVKCRAQEHGTGEYWVEGTAGELCCVDPQVLPIHKVSLRGLSLQLYVEVV
eukprot:TRINITY_DN13782_c0_g1_i2.p2 TRINITY_DN13782_c0_g1~~TRINITY_DN13782_c0_g1_i2.p2  ORF type:complete len:187 (-),score=55.66 TRINITY_DN13782_c0_g1_i2:288-848(-)